MYQVIEIKETPNGQMIISDTYGVYEDSDFAEIVIAVFNNHAAATRACDRLRRQFPESEFDVLKIAKENTE